MYIVKKGEEITMPVIRDKADAILVVGPDKRVPKQRFKVLPGAGGFYIYDYQKFDVVKEEGGGFFTTLDRNIALRFLTTLPQTNLTIKDEKREVIIHE